MVETIETLAEEIADVVINHVEIDVQAEDVLKVQVLETEVTDVLAIEETESLTTLEEIDAHQNLVALYQKDQDVLDEEIKQ